MSNTSSMQDFANQFMSQTSDNSSDDSVKTNSANTNSTAKNAPSMQDFANQFASVDPTSDNNTSSPSINNIKNVNNVPSSLTGWGHKLGELVAGAEQGAAMRILPGLSKLAYPAAQYIAGAYNAPTGSSISDKLVAGAEAVGNPQDTLTNLASHAILNKDIGATQGLGDMATNLGGMALATGYPAEALAAAPTLAMEDPGLVKQLLAMPRQYVGNVLQQLPSYAGGTIGAIIGSNVAGKVADANISDNNPYKKAIVANAELAGGMGLGSLGGLTTQRLVAPAAGNVFGLSKLNNLISGTPSTATTDLARVQEATLGGTGQPDEGVVATKVLTDQPETQVDTQVEPMQINTSEDTQANPATSEFAKLIETPTEDAATSEEEAKEPLQMAQKAMQISKNIKAVNNDLYDTVNDPVTGIGGKTIPISRQAIQDLMNQSAIQAHSDMPLTPEELNQQLDQAAEFADKNPNQAFANIPDLKGSVGFIKDKLNSILGLSNPGIEGPNTEVSNPTIQLNNEDHTKLLNLLNSTSKSLNLINAPTHVTSFVNGLPAILRQAKINELFNNPKYAEQGLGPMQLMADKMYAIRMASQQTDPTLQAFANADENPKSAANAEQTFMNNITPTTIQSNPLAHLDYQNQIAQQAAAFSKNPDIVNQNIEENQGLLGQLHQAAQNKAVRENTANQYEKSLIRTKAQLEGRQPQDGIIPPITNDEQSPSITPISTPYQGVKTNLAKFMNKGKFNSDAFANQLMEKTETPNDAMSAIANINKYNNPDMIDKTNNMILEKANQEYNKGAIDPENNTTTISKLSNLYNNLGSKHPLAPAIKGLINKSVDNNISSAYKPGQFQQVGEYIDQVKKGITRTRSLAQQLLGDNGISDILSPEIKRELADSRTLGTQVKDGLNNDSLKSMSQMLDNYSKQFGNSNMSPSLASQAANRLVGLKNIMDARERVAADKSFRTIYGQDNILNPVNLISHGLLHGAKSMIKTALTGYGQGNNSAVAINKWLGNLPTKLNTAAGRASLLEDLKSAQALNKHMDSRQKALNQLGPTIGAYMGGNVNQ